MTLTIAAEQSRTNPTSKMTHRVPFFAKMQQMSTASLSNADQIDAAISEHAESRQRAILKGRVLRMFYSDVDTSLSQEDLHELDFQLPKLPQSSDMSPRVDMLSIARAKKNAS